MASSPLLFRRAPGYVDSHEDDDDPDTNHLLPTSPTSRTRTSHQVRVQGRLVLVRTVSAANLRAPAPSVPSVPSVPPLPTTVTGAAPARAAPAPTTRRSCDETSRRHRDSHDQGGRDSSSYEYTEEAPSDRRAEPVENKHETALRDRQRRGYGIGGAGNIRRPTEVMFFYSSRRSPTTVPSMAAGSDGRERCGWSWMRRLGLRGARRREETTA